MGRRVMRVNKSERCEYEATRNARILQNQARLESLGLLKTLSELRQTATPPKRHYRKNNLHPLTPLRRSLRLAPSTPPPFTPKQEKETLSEGEEEKNRPANAPFIKIRGADLQSSPEGSARRCNSKGRGSVYNPVFGICCHFCRQKKLCGEEDCKRCGNFDVDEPCLGKTDCSACHSSTGVFCRACLKVRYGEEMEEVRENKEWMCPHCIEEKGINPYWICNSSICLRKRKKAPTGLAIYKAREMGYKSVAHLLMDELKRGSKHSKEC